MYLKKCVPLLFNFFVNESTENWPEERRGEGESMGHSFFHITFLFSPLFPRANSLDGTLHDDSMQSTSFLVGLHLFPPT
jgi:hypothetical protein